MAENNWITHRSKVKCNHMGKASKQKNLQRKRPAPKMIWVCVSILLLAFGGFSLQTWLREAPHEEQVNVRNEPASSPTSLLELIGLKPAEWEKVDIALMNLLCADGLRGSEKLSINYYIEQLDLVAGRVGKETKSHSYRFYQKPAEFNHSEAYFKMMMLTVVLQEDFAIRYNPARVSIVGSFEPNEIFFADSRDIFINGLIEEKRHMGTCSSLPVLYVAVARRLGYPVKLVATKNHLFVRWEDEQERLNIEATAKGFSTYSDDHYKTWPFPVSSEEMEKFGYLKSLSAAEELAVFFSLRGQCLMSMKRPEFALNCFKESMRLDADNRLYAEILNLASMEAQHIQALQNFPKDPVLRSRLLMGEDPVLLQAEGLADESAKRARANSPSPTIPDPFAVPKLPLLPNQTAVTVPL